ncbi:MAG: carbohydrate kinase family protein [Acidimicrobiia bacterium]
MPAPKWDVLGVGCNSVDYVYRLPASPRADSPTAKLRITSHGVMCGGQTATAMAACATFGLKAAYLGCTGNDANGSLVATELQQHGVDVSAVLTRDCANRFAVITVDETSGERVVLWDRDDRLNLRTNEIDPALIAAARVVHVDDEDQEAAITAATLARRAGIDVTSDIDRLTGRLQDLVDAVTVPILGEHVLPALTGESDPERGLRALRLRHAGMLCVTLGPRGAMLLVGDQLYQSPAVAVTAVDTTAAGDVFRAGFIRAWLAGQSPGDMLRFANTAAAITCTRAGAMASVPALAEVEHAIAG